MAKKLKYELAKTTYIDNDIIRYSDAFRKLNTTQMNLFLFICCLAKEQYDVNRDIETDGKKTGWSDEIEINMENFVFESGMKTKWQDLSPEKKDIVLEYFNSLKTKEFIIYKNAKRRLSEGFTSYNYLCYADYNKETKILRLVMPENTRKFFMNYDSYFTPYELGQVIQLKTETSKLLYLYLRSFWDDSKKKFLPTSLTMENLKDVLGKNAQYKKYADFKRYVLIPAIQEINEKTDITISGDWDKYRKLLGENTEKDLSQEELDSIKFKSMEMTHDGSKKITGITFRMQMKDKVEKYNFLNNLIDDEVLVKRMQRKAIAREMNKATSNKKAH